MNRKIMAAVCALCLSQGGWAQEENVTKTAPAESENGIGNVWSVDYLGLDGGSGLGLNLSVGHVVLTGGLTFGDKPEGITENEGWNIGLGYGYRYWLGKSLFVEGQVGAAYYHGTIKYRYVSDTQGHYGVSGRYYTTNTYATEKETSSEFGAFLTPRVGLKLFKFKDQKIGLVAGYRWDFVKFKFDKEHTADYFTIGIMGVF